jgi:hypothetical protein
VSLRVIPPDRGDPRNDVAIRLVDESELPAEAGYNPALTAEPRYQPLVSVNVRR